MGDPKKLRKKYVPVRHPWQGPRIIAEKKLVKEYGLKNKTEIYKARSFLRTFAKQAKKFASFNTEQGDKEKKQLMNRLERLGLLSSNSSLDQVLALTIEHILGRRLQTLVYKKGLTKTISQSRQFITHGHVSIKGQKVSIPGYIVNSSEENEIEFVKDSSLSSLDHPERKPKEKIELKKEVNENVE